MLRRFQISNRNVKNKRLEQNITNMKMNKRLIFVFIAASLLLIAGCMGGTKKKGPITDVDIRKGTDGLTMSFTKNAPPERVFEGSEENPSLFPIAVRLRNQGAADIEPVETVFNIGVWKDDGGGSYKDFDEQPGTVEGKLVFGFDPYVELDDESKAQQELKIDGKSIFNPNGDEDSITINAKAKTIGAQSETQSSTIRATACYPYKTIFGASVCIDSDIYGTKRGEKACSVRDLSFGNGQGAPVAITKIETRMLPQRNNLVKPHFLIHIENKGNGEVVSLSEVENACTGKRLDYRAFNTIIIKASLSGETLDCPAEIRLKEKEDLVRCTGEVVEREDAYVAPLSVELEYGYTFTISKNIIIEKILTR